MPERLRTMRNAIAWSYDLLSPEEQAAVPAAVGVRRRVLAEAAAAAVADASDASSDRSVGGHLVAGREESARTGRRGRPARPASRCWRRSGSSGWSNWRPVARTMRRAPAIGRMVPGVAETSYYAFFGPEHRQWLARLDAEHDNCGRRSPGRSTAARPRSPSGSSSRFPPSGTCAVTSAKG